MKTAFLNGKLKEVIYMKQPPGMEDKNHEDCGCRLNKELYGLKQSAKNWYDELNETLQQYKFTRCDSDPCLYKHGNTTRSYLSVHVDDTLIISLSPERIKAIAQLLDEKFCIVDLCDVS